METTTTTPAGGLFTFDRPLPDYSIYIFCQLFKENVPNLVLLAERRIRNILS